MNIAIWRIVTVGLYRDGDGLIKAFRGRIFDVTHVDYLWQAKLGFPWEGKPRFPLAQEILHIPLCKATVLHLTGKREATTLQIWDAIRLAGDLVPAEVGPALRVQYLDQPAGEGMYIASEPILDFDQLPVMFRVGNLGIDCGLYLTTPCWDEERVYGGEEIFIFAPKFSA